jgi:hypothetical protein
MKEPEQWTMFRRTKPPSRGVLLLIVAAVVSPTHSYLLQEIRFWIVVVAVLVSLGVLLVVTFILLQEASHRGLGWMKLHVGRITGVKPARLIVRSAVPSQLPHR